jgi:hypothetical protein
MKTEQGGRLYDHGAAQNPLWVQKQRPKPQQHPVADAEVRGASALAPDHKQLLFEEQILGNNRFDSARSKQRCQRHHQMGKEHENESYNPPIYQRNY